MEDKHGMVQSSVRTDKEQLYEAQYYLNLEGISMNKFWQTKLREFLEDYRQQHPERVPRGVQ